MQLMRAPAVLFAAVALTGLADGQIRLVKDIYPGPARSLPQHFTMARHGIQTTPSGAASFAALRDLDLPADSRCLLVVSEGPEGQAAAHGSAPK